MLHRRQLFFLLFPVDWLIGLLCSVEIKETKEAQRLFIGFSVSLSYRLSPLSSCCPAPLFLRLIVVAPSSRASEVASR
ncbi:hypothetical protein DFH94DRAFT_786343 [Russula ochroleuca]|uniref:Secreted protein n=1 Tax=Russula ochroleuca TaxID=152965 RepID=A0A9P5MMI7_9AGAM|nr:hypothetical protein DFH94DRAFT_786343 [Russula ochroleuca]